MTISDKQRIYWTLHKYVAVAGRDYHDLDLGALYAIDRNLKQKDPRLTQ